MSLSRDFGLSLAELSGGAAQPTWMLTELLLARDMCQSVIHDDSYRADADAIEYLVRDQYAWLHADVLKQNADTLLLQLTEQSLAHGSFDALALKLTVDAGCVCSSPAVLLDAITAEGK